MPQSAMLAWDKAENVSFGDQHPFIILTAYVMMHFNIISLSTNALYLHT